MKVEGQTLKLMSKDDKSFREKKLRKVLYSVIVVFYDEINTKILRG